MDQLLIKLLTLTNKQPKLKKYLPLMTTAQTNTSLTLERLKKNPIAYSFYINNLPESDILLAEFCIKLKQIYKCINDYLIQIALYPNVIYENKKLKIKEEIIYLRINSNEEQIIIDIMNYKETYFKLKKINNEKIENICQNYEKIVMDNDDLLKMYVELNHLYFFMDNLSIYSEVGMEMQFYKIRNCYLNNKFDKINTKICIDDLCEENFDKSNNQLNFYSIMETNKLCKVEGEKSKNLYLEHFDKILLKLDKQIGDNPNKIFIKNSLLMDEGIINAFQNKIKEEEKENKHKYLELALKQFKRIKDTILFGRSDFIQTLFILLRDSAYKNKRSFYYILENAFNSSFKKFNRNFNKQNFNKILSSETKYDQSFNEPEEEMDLDIQIEEKENQWNYITIIPLIKYPLDIFINVEEVNKLIYIFKILFRIKKTENHLTTLRFKQKNPYKLETIKFTDFILRLNRQILCEILENLYKKEGIYFLHKVVFFFNEKKLCKMLVELEEFCVNVSKNKKFTFFDCVKEFIESINWEEGLFFTYCKWYLNNC